MRPTLRLLQARPAFSAVVLLTLALGIGAPVAVFSVVHTVLLRPLPYPQADRLVQFRIESRSPAGSVAFDALPAAAALQWRAESSALQSLALYNDRALTLPTVVGPERLSGIAATPNLFAVMSVAPLVGQTFDDATRDSRQIVLSHGLWVRHFASDPSVVGASVRLDGETYLVRGVMPPSFQFPTPEAAFWVPLVLDLGGSRGMLLPAIARLVDGATLPSVIEEGQHQLQREGMARETRTLIVRTVHDQLVGPVERVLWIVLAAVVVVSAIATANIALLLLLRGAGRASEFAVRVALGASRRQLAQHLAAEALTLSMLGGTAGVLLAMALLQVLRHTAPPSVPRLQEIGVDGPVLLFAVAVTLVTTAVFGVLSAGRTIAVDVVQGLAGGWREGPLVHVRSPRARMRALASFELALTMVLLVAAGVLLQSFLALVMIDHGFDTRDAIALRVSLAPSRYPSIESRAAFHARLVDALARLPGVEHAGVITAMPNRQPSARFDFNPSPSPPVVEPFSRQVAEVRTASEGFFEAMGIRVRGRTFTPHDTAGEDGVVIVSAQLAQQHFPNEDPIGRMLYSGAAGAVRVIGVASDVRPADGRMSSPSAYLPLRQDPDVLRWFASINVVLRGRDGDQMASAARAAVHALDRDVPVFDVRTLDTEVAGLVAGPRFVAWVLTAFGVTALVLAAIGVYGVMAYCAGRRVSEIGVRLALGATEAQIIRTMMRDGVVIVGGGLLAGGLGAMALSQILSSIVPEAPPIGWTAIAVVGGVLATAATVAALVPTRRAARVGPLAALRHE